MNEQEALNAIISSLEDSLEYFEYVDTVCDGDEHADIYWNIKDTISDIENILEKK